MISFPVLGTDGTVVALIAVNHAFADFMKFMRAVRLDKMGAQLGKHFSRFLYGMHSGFIIWVHEENAKRQYESI